MIYAKVVFTILCLTSLRVRFGGGETVQKKDKSTGVSYGLKVIHNSLIKLRRIPKLILLVLIAIYPRTFGVRGAEDSETTNKRIEQFRQSISENTRLDKGRKTAVLDRLKVFQDSLRTRKAEVDLGSATGAKQYKTELSLLAAYFDAGLPMDSGFGKWLKDDLELQVEAAQINLKKQTELTEEQMTNRKMVLDQLVFDLTNLGSTMTTGKMMEHTNWLDDNYEGFKRRRGSRH